MIRRPRYDSHNFQRCGDLPQKPPGRPDRPRGAGRVLGAAPVGVPPVVPVPVWGMGGR